MLIRGDGHPVAECQNNRVGKFVTGAACGMKLLSSGSISNDKPSEEECFLRRSGFLCPITCVCAHTYFIAKFVVRQRVNVFAPRHKTGGSVSVMVTHASRGVRIFVTHASRDGGRTTLPARDRPPRDRASRGGGVSQDGATWRHHEDAAVTGRHLSPRRLKCHAG